MIYAQGQDIKRRPVTLNEAPYPETQPVIFVGIRRSGVKPSNDCIQGRETIQEVYVWKEETIEEDVGQGELHPKCAIRRRNTISD